MKKNRDSNIEMLRIIAMLFILFHHYALYNSLYNLDVSNMNKYIGIILFSLGKIGVNIFILITGYFSIKKIFSIKKLIKLWLEVVFYSVGVTFVFAISGKVQLNFKELIKFIFPISFNKYWFITIYIILYTLMPFINRYVKKVNKEQYQKLLVILFFLCVGLYSIMYSSTTYSMNESLPLSNIIFYILVYLIGGYIRLYGIEKIENISCKRTIGYTLLIFCVFTIFLTVSEIIDYKYNKLGNVLFWYTRSNSIFVYILSILTFYSFKKIELKEIKIINLLASSCFGIYLIQSHTFIAGKKLYKDIIHTEYFVKSPLLIVQAIASIIVIYFIGGCIDLVRQKVIEDKIIKIKKFDSFFNKIDKLFND